MSGNGTSTTIVATQGGACAYEIVGAIHPCLFGTVDKAVKLVRAPADNAEDARRWVRPAVEEVVAIKTIDRARAELMTSAEDPLEELAIMQQLQRLQGAHPNVVRLHEVAYDGDSIFAVLEYCTDGELLAHIEAHGAMAAPVARRLFREIVEGARHMHAGGVSHRDLSPENVLLTSSSSSSSSGDGTLAAKIIDLGMALLLDAGTPLPRPSRRWVGKSRYVPPEVITQRVPLRSLPHFSVDMWPLGVMLWIMLVGSPPWERADHQDPAYCYYLQHGAVDLLDQWNIETVPVAAIDLIEGLLCPDPWERLTVDEVLAHPWMVA